jgi:hypothetical protein
LAKPTLSRKAKRFRYKTEILAVKSTGDIILDKPLYELGITGIFTKTLDVAMINGDVDIGAFHEGCSYGITYRNCASRRSRKSQHLGHFGAQKEILIFLMKVHCHRKFASSGAMVKQISQSQSS